MHASVGGMESLCVMVSVTGGVYAHGKGGHNSSPTGPLPSPPPMQFIAIPIFIPMLHLPARATQYMCVCVVPGRFNFGLRCGTTAGWESRPFGL